MNRNQKKTLEMEILGLADQCAAGPDDPACVDPRLVLKEVAGALRRLAGRSAAASPALQLDPWRVELTEVVDHLGAAVLQATASHDRIIMDHVKSAHEIAKIVRRRADFLAQPETAEPVKLTYTNYRGETAERTIIPKSVRFGSTEWHPEPQWLLLAVAAAIDRCARVAEQKIERYVEGMSGVDVRASFQQGYRWREGPQIAAAIRAQHSTNDGYAATLDAVREEMGLDTASRPIVRKSESEVSA